MIILVYGDSMGGQYIHLIIHYHIYINDIYDFIYSLVYSTKINKKNISINFICSYQLLDIEEMTLINQFTLYEKYQLDIKPDGGYLDVYLNNKKLATYVSASNEMFDEYKNLMNKNTCDLSRIPHWPKRADGSMDYPKPTEVKD